MCRGLVFWRSPFFVGVGEDLSVCFGSGIGPYSKKAAQTYVKHHRAGDKQKKRDICAVVLGFNETFGDSQTLPRRGKSGESSFGGSPFSFLQILKYEVLGPSGLALQEKSKVTPSGRFRLPVRETSGSPGATNAPCTGIWTSFSPLIRPTEARKRFFSGIRWHSIWLWVKSNGNILG